MLKVLLVDDEILTVRMLQSLIDWRQYNLELAGVAQDGVEAYEAFEKYNPHIVITDINMPNMNGIEFVKKAKRRNKHTEFILVSAYGDFSYVQEAMKEGCSDYILKPVDEQELNKALATVIEKINGEKEQKRKMEENEEQIKRLELSTYMRTGHESTRTRDLPQSGSFNFENYYLLIIQMNHNTIDEYVSMHNMEMMQLDHMNELLDSVLNSYKNILFEYEEDSWVILISEINQEELKKLSKDIIQLVHTHYNINVMACFSDVITGISDLPVQYKKTKLLSRYNFYIDSDNVLGFGYNYKEEDFNQIPSADLVKEVEAALKEKDIMNAEKLIDEIFFLSKNINPMDLDYIYDICFQIIMLLKNIVLQYHTKTEQNNRILMLTYQDLLNLKSFKELKEFMWIAIEQTLQQDEKSRNKYSKIVEESIQILKERYNENLTLDGICNQISVSKSYFSYLFKREVGINLWSYLTELRLNEAKRLLLETDMKSWEISFEVGYENPSYFSKLFKKYESMTPNEYRKQKK
ncbi:response regulator [Virgibacillus sp. SK37]|uniref:response regulator transcription factor n=1 Tax=Virgibacillus sp. SK37 TaxID=403957 RepID=UPI0004D11812|nr:response regulator [Virgibacillus sp. SK37]AIF45587.1 hypothetical protein X953_16790 [Virgibacillus sp. SK37]